MNKNLKKNLIKLLKEAYKLGLEVYKRFKKWKKM